MSLGSYLQGKLQNRLDEGASVKLRHAFPHPGRMLRALRQRHASAPDMSADPAIIVVGIGPAALSALRALHDAGRKNVTIVALDTLFGGKCINFGCMPAEFVLTRRDLGLGEKRAQLEIFVQELRADAEQEFRGFNYPTVQAEAVCVEGKHLVLGSGERLAFDFLVLANGSSYPKPRIVLGEVRPCRVEDIWTLPAGAKLVIYAENNPSAISLGLIARALGFEPVILAAGANPFATLPSFRYFLRCAQNEGVKIYQGVKLRHVAPGHVRFEQAGKMQDVSFDHVMIASRPVPDMLPVDGKTPSIYDLDLRRGCLPARPDIVFLGDAGGYFSASDAEAQASLVVESWSGGAADLTLLASNPVILDGESPLVMLGKEWTLGARNWAELDFRALGWTKIRRDEGKLWYLLNEATGRLDALHICHPAAKSLAATARLLMDYDVRDPRWQLIQPHPSGSEIFKILARRAGTSLRRTRAAEALPQAALFELPPLTDLSPHGKLPSWLSRENAAAALLAPEPRRALAAVMALESHAGLAGVPSGCRLSLRDGDVVLPAQAGIHLAEDVAARICAVESASFQVRVRY
jgi:pyruvate/2-oxoglutarate dehydrogenase complex dihydrolipoamide dehydrogenase (E3) component